MKKIGIFAVGGPPHSGKSVLIRALLSLGRYYIVPVQPDGEGPGWSSWTLPEVVSEIRRKGDFRDRRTWEAFASWASALCENLQRVGRMVILDLGGKPSPENEAILSAIRGKGGLVILCREDKFDEVSQWGALAEKAGTPVVAIIKSKLNGESRIEEGGPVFRATLAGLERGREEEVARDPVTRALHSFLSSLGGEGEEETPWWNGSRIDVPGLGKALGLKEERGRLWWEPSILPSLWEALQGPWPPEVIIGGPGPNWVYIAISHALHPSRLLIEDPKVQGGVVSIPALDLIPKTTCLVAWEVSQATRHVVFGMRIEGYVLDPARLGEVQVPKPPQGMGVVLEGRAPLWLYVAVARALWHIVPWVGVAQPHLYQGRMGFVVAVSHDPTVPLGTVEAL